MAPLITITVQALLGSLGLQQHQQKVQIEVSVPTQAIEPYHAQPIEAHPIQAHPQPIEAQGTTPPLTSLSAISWSPNRLDIYGKTNASSPTIAHKYWDGYSWQPSSDKLEDLGAAGTVNVAAVSWGTNRADIFAANEDGKLTHKFWDGTAWQPQDKDVEVLGDGLGLNGTLAATSWGEGRLDVFGLSAGDGEGGKELLHKYWDGSQWNPTDGSLENLGGDLEGGVSAVSWGEGRLDIVAVDGEKKLKHIYYDGTKWSDWETFPTESVNITQPTIVSWGINRLDIFAIGADDGALWHTAWDGSQWLRGESLGGSNLVGPVSAVSWGPNRIDIVALGSDQGYYYKYWDGSQWNPTDNTLYPKGGKFASVPALTSWGVNRLDIFGVTDDLQLGHQTWYGSGWYPEWNFENLGGALALGSHGVAKVHKEL